jgi:hypothetical protein
LISTGPRHEPVALMTVGDDGELVADLLAVVDHDRSV